MGSRSDADRHTCMICKSTFVAADPARHKTYPFCSERCRMADLSHWFDGNYRIAGERVSNPENDDPSDSWKDDVS